GGATPASTDRHDRAGSSRGNAAVGTRARRGIADASTARDCGDRRHSDLDAAVSDRDPGDSVLSHAWPSRHDGQHRLTRGGDSSWNTHGRSLYFTLLSASERGGSICGRDWRFSKEWRCSRRQSSAGISTPKEGLTRKSRKL